MPRTEQLRAVRFRADKDGCLSAPAFSGALIAIWKELEWQPRSDHEHRAIMEAVRKRNARAATTALRDHILAAGYALCGMLETARQAPRNSRNR